MKRSSSAQAVTPADVSMDFPSSSPDAVGRDSEIPPEVCRLTRGKRQFCHIRLQREEVSCSASTQRQRAAVCPRRPVTHKQMTVLYTTDRRPAGRAAESVCRNNDERERKADVNRMERILRQRTEGGPRLERGEREREEEGRALEESSHWEAFRTLSEWKH